MTAVGSRGPLLIIGGAEDKLGSTAVLRRFVRLSGGRRSRLVVIPTASSVQDEMIEVYSSVLTRLGAGSVEGVRPSSRRDADDPQLAAVVDAASGVFMTGGNQLKLSQVVTGTRLGDALTAAHARGAVVAGTSAGASVMSAYMISMGDEGVTPRQRASQLSAGLGLLEGVIVDQHFDQRARYGRLLSLVATSPALLGVGIDEDTAAQVSDGRWLEVVGSGAVFVADARQATTDAHEARSGAPLLVSGVVVHTLPTGARFDLQERRLVDYQQMRPDPQTKVSHQDRDEARAAVARLRAWVTDVPAPGTQAER